MNSKQITFGIVVFAWFIALSHGYGLILMDGIPGIGMALMTTFWFLVGFVVSMLAGDVHKVVRSFTND